MDSCFVLQDNKSYFDITHNLKGDCFEAVRIDKLDEALTYSTYIDASTWSIALAKGKYIRKEPRKTYKVQLKSQESLEQLRVRKIL